MQNKLYLTDAQIHELIKTGEKACPADKFAQLRKVGKKYSLFLNGDQKTNLNAVWKKWLEMMDKEQPGSKFRLAFNERWPQSWNTLRHTRDSIMMYIDFIGAQSDYELLCDPCWIRLAEFASIGAKKYKVVNNSSFQTFIAIEGDYSIFFSQYSKDKADQELIKKSEQLYKIIGELFSDSDKILKLKLVLAIKKMSFAEMSVDQLHFILHS